MRCKHTFEAHNQTMLCRACGMAFRMDLEVYNLKAFQRACAKRKEGHSWEVSQRDKTLLICRDCMAWRVFEVQESGTL